MKIKRANEGEVRGIRFPLKLWKSLADAAEDNDRTIAREVIRRLQESFKYD